MFQFPRFAPQAYGFSLRWPARAGRVSPFGHPRITAFLPAPRGFSQAHAPFVASCRLGIHRVRLFAWPYNPNRPGRGARAVFDFASLSTFAFLCAGASARPAGLPARHPSAPARTSQTVKDATGAARAPGRPTPTRKRTPCACGSPRLPPAVTARSLWPPQPLRPPTGTFRARPFCLAAFPRPGPPARWWSQGGSNSRPPACKAGALPAELWPRGLGGGSGRNRTSDLTLIRGAL